MEKWKENFLSLVKNKLYMLALSFTAAGGYGFLVTHQTVGIDDTPYAYYFEEGLNAIVGRWFLFLLNKIFHISDFTPFLTDLAGVLILMLGVTVWCALLRSICGERVPLWGYVFFSCIFLSCPLLSEVYTYYLHNGVSVGYLCTGVSLCFFRELVLWAGGRQDGRTSRRKSALAAGGMAFFLFLALGCYESFMIVWLLGILLVLLTGLYMGEKNGMIRLLGLGAAAAAVSVLLRSLMIRGVTACFGLGYMEGEAVQRSLGELLGWIFQPGASAEFAMAVKRFIVMYFAFYHAYYPVRIFVYAAGVMALLGLVMALRRRKPWLALLTLGCFPACFLLVFVEGKATLYRSAQFLPVVCGYGAFLLAYGAEGLRRRGAALLIGSERFSGIRKKAAGFCGRIAGGAMIFLLCSVLWNQIFDMNRWFYVDWLKYQAALDTMNQIAFILERDYDLSKPVVFTGSYQPPESIVSGAYVGYGTETFYRINRITQLMDPHLLEKFYREYGVWVAQTPALSIFGWGIDAFGTDEELARFFAMHGHKIRANTDSELFEEATGLSADFPGFPAQGSIADMGEYIIVHF